MSLIVWYPLIRDLKNQGLDGENLTQSSTAVTFTSGLFGKSATFTQGNSQYLIRPKLTLTKNISIACWFKATQANAQMVLFNSSNGQGTKGWSIWTGYPSKTLYFQFGDMKWNYANHPIPLNEWFHLALVVDDNSNYYCYLNGEQLSAGTVTTLPDYSDGNYISLGVRYCNAAIDQPFYGQAQDFRIYDHALSIKEIKELSKGLILHHDLKGYGAGENILPENWLNSGTLEFDESIDRYVHVRDITTTSESYLAIGRTAQVEKSTQYTFSTWVWINDNVRSIEFFWLSDTEENKKTGTSWVNVTSTSTTGDTTNINNKLIPNKWNYVTWTFTTKSDDYTGYIRYDNNGSKTEGEHAILKACCPKLEKGSKATPYIPYSLTKTDIRTVPSAYAPLEYIEGTGTQYINTGYVHKATTRIDIVCELKEAISSNFKALFGTRNGSYRDNSFNLFTIYGYKAIPMFSRTGNEKSGTGLLYNEKILISAYDKTCTWYKYGSTTASGSVTTTGTADAGFNKMLLFDLNVSTTADGVTPGHGGNFCKIYSCKIWDDNGTTLVRDFIPAMRKSDMKIGLYDAVNNTFYTNAGTGEFLTSPDIIEEDLSGNGFNGTRQGVTFTPDSPRYYMSTEFDANKDLILDRIFHQGDEVSNLSVSIWVKFKGDTSNPVIWSLNSSQLIRIEKTSGENQIHIAAYMNDGIQYMRVIPEETIEQNKWYHLILTFDNGIFKFYMNSLLVGTFNKTSIATSLKCNNSTSRWALGKYDYGNDLVGKLSDFRIYAKTLTADEVKELYQTSALIDKSGKMYCGEFVEE